MFSRFRRIQFKLTCSYILITSAVITVLLVALASGIAGALSNLSLDNVVGVFSSEILSVELGPILDGPDAEEAAAAWLSDNYSPEGLQVSSPYGTIDFTYDQVYDLVLIDQAGQIISAGASEGESIQSFEEIPAEGLGQWERASSFSNEWEPVLYTEPGREMLWSFIPIRFQGETVGTVVARTPPGSGPGSWGEIFFGIVIPFLVPTICLASLVGLFFGLVSAGGYGRRLRRLTAAADTWSTGDFSPVIRDRSRDEIGQLGRQLNRMADEIESLLHSQTALATIEERNRIARDLHDSAKQQIFAAGMQISTAKALFENDPETAKQHLSEAENLTKEVQKELSGLIQELRPAQLANKGLAEALRAEIKGWSLRNGVATDFAVKGDRSLPVGIEEELLRITQEGLSNIAKHSQATKADILLQIDNDTIDLTIMDNGVGFNPQAKSVGFGLTSIKERIEKLSGSLTIETMPNEGTKLFIHIPYSRE